MDHNHSSQQKHVDVETFLDNIQSKYDGVFPQPEIGSANKHGDEIKLEKTVSLIWKIEILKKLVIESIIAIKYGQHYNDKILDMFQRLQITFKNLDTF